MTSISSAHDTALPAIIEPTPRRGFLRQLASLPLIGGGMKLFGTPTASAEPVTERLLWDYKDWLFFEHRMLSYELAGHDCERAKAVQGFFRNECEWHFQWARDGARGPAGWDDAPQPSTRAALVLAAVGCDWRGDEPRDRRRA